MQPGWFTRERTGSESPAPEGAATPGLTRRDFLERGVATGVAAAVAAGGALAASHERAHAQADNPFGRPWWPSPFGPQDEVGATQRITPAKVLEAARLIRTGRIFRLGRVLEPGIPVFGNRHLSLTIPGGPTGGPFGTARLVYNDELFSGEIGQLGTQFDGLGHIATLVGGEPVYYNGFKQSEVGGAYGLRKLGIEHVRPIVTRGVLIDALGLKGGDRLPVGHVLTPADLQAALARQGVREPGEGDVVLVRTGHGKLWMKDNAEFTRGAPGIGVSAARWLIERRVCVVGTDHWAGEAVPGEDKDRPFECHQWLIMMNGIHLHENLDLEELAAQRVWEFAFVFAPLRLRGATGSPGEPLAIV